MSHHELFKTLSPIDWNNIPHDSLPDFLATTFTKARCLIDSLPIPAGSPAAAAAGASASTFLTTTTPTATTTRPRSQTESALHRNTKDFASSPPPPPLSTTTTTRDHAVSSPPDPRDAASAAQLLKEWKEVKLSPKDNPLSVSVYKLSAKDGKGSWFARRSIHHPSPTAEHPLTFDKFKLGLEREFAESLPRTGPDGRIEQSAPGEGNVRGIGADKRVERRACKGVGRAEVYLLSAQFPGPTTPRDFVTLLCSSDEGNGKGRDGGGADVVSAAAGPRQFVIVSKPCVHAECAARTGYIRGQYESVEMIREVPLEGSVQRTRSSDGLSARESSDGDTPVKKAVSFVGDDAEAQQESRPKMAIEWLMITRSDPGGSVPRFMVEKGTPGGIVTDAGKFLKWLEAKTTDELRQEEVDDAVPSTADVGADADASAGEAHVMSNGALNTTAITVDKQDKTEESSTTAPHTEQHDVAPPPLGGFYNMIAGAVGAAGTAVVARLPESLHAATSSLSTATTLGESSNSDSDDDEDTRSFVSAQSNDGSSPHGTDHKVNAHDSTQSDILSRSLPNLPTSTNSSSIHEKHLRKLQERRQKVEDKIAKHAAERDLLLSKSTTNNTTSANSASSTTSSTAAATGTNALDEENAAALAKLKIKHEKELSRQEESYAKEVRKLEARRLKEERKQAEREKKAREKEEKSNATLALARVTAERDVALKQIDMLKEQVGELQRLNTGLVARLGKVGGEMSGV